MITLSASRRSSQPNQIPFRRKKALRKKAYKSENRIHVTDIRPGLVDTAMAKGDDLFWLMPVEKVASQIIAAIRKQKSKAYVTKRWHILGIINKSLPFTLYKRL